MRRQFTYRFAAATASVAAGLLLASCVNHQAAVPADSNANQPAAQTGLVQTEFNRNFSAYFQRIASDEMQGRAPATQGEENTVRYLEQQFARIGLTPYKDGSYRQPVAAAWSGT